MRDVEDTLLFLNRQGIFPYAGESLHPFLQRAERFNEPKTIEFFLTPALLLCEKLFDMRPTWVEVQQKQKGLSLWQGAALWVQEGEPFIQISPRLSKQFKRWYTLEEVVAHELLHAARLTLCSSHFEEIAAYQTSPQRYRRYFGPLIRSPAEVYVFLGALVCLGVGSLWPLFSYCAYLAPFLCLYALMRLFIAQRTFRRCREKLAFLLQEKSKALALLVRLTDEEVRLFAHSSQQEIYRYVEQKKEQELRWRMLTLAYPFSVTSLDGL